MSYVIVAKGTGLIVTDGPNHSKAYKTFGAAKATRTRLCNKAGWSESDLLLAKLIVRQAGSLLRT
jgi:hypothetical protein